MSSRTEMSSSSSSTSERGFPPAGAAGPNDSPRCLILGSFPSLQSLEKVEYYGNPRNHFWPLVASCLGKACPSDYEGRIAMLRESDIALWDMYAACTRAGSLDSGIGEAEPNPVMEYIAARPSIILVGLNGGEAAKAFVRQLKSLQTPGIPGPVPAGILASSESSLQVQLCGRHSGTPDSCRQFLLWRLPSSSPVPTSKYRGFDERLAAWKKFFTIHMYGLLADRPGNGYSGHTIWTS